MKPNLQSLARALVAGLVAVPIAAMAQSYPTKPVRFIVPFPPGGATDISARMLGQKLSEMWGQTVVIENRGGAGGSVGAAEAARAVPDGYTLFFPSGSVLTANQHIYRNLPYNPERDFIPVTNVVSGAQVLTVPAGSPYKSVKELVDAARANPGKLTFGHAGIGSQPHLAAENFLYQAKIDALAVHLQAENIRRARFRSRPFAATDGLAQALARVTVPLKTIWGTRDIIARPSLEARLDILRRHHPELQVRLIEGAGHWVAYEAAEQFNAALLELLGRN